MTMAQPSIAQTYPVPNLVAYLEHQAELFEQAKPKLWEKFAGRYIWFEDGRVLDSDLNHEALVLRIYGEGEPRSLFIRKIVAVEPRFLVRSSLRLK